MTARKGMTLVEILVVLAIVAILAALLTPTLMEARRAAQRTRCMSNLRQIHAAISLYRTAEGRDGVYGETHEMGLPAAIGPLVFGTPAERRWPRELITCRGYTEHAHPTGYSFHFSGPPGTPERPSGWAWNVRRYQENMILVSDMNHDLEPYGLDSPARRHRALGVYLDGHVRVVVGYGHPNTSSFFLSEVPEP